MAVDDSQSAGRCQDTPLDTAWKYLSLGRSIIPTEDKRPATPGHRWKAYQHRLPFEDEFLTWAEYKPPSWAVVAGTVSDNLTIVDCDTPAAVGLFHDEGLQPHITTPRDGQHFYFSGNLPSGVRTIDGISFEVRSAGTYANFAGYTQYGQYVTHQIALDGPGSLYHLSDVGAELQRVLGSITERIKGRSRQSDQWPDVIPEGQRHSYLVSMAGSIRHQMTREESEAFLMTLNQLKCKPPLSVEEVLQIASSIERYGYQPEPLRQIPDSYLKALSHLKVSPSAYRVLLGIVQRTVALGKVRDTIFRGDLALATGIIDESNVSRAIRELQSANVIEVHRSGKHGATQGPSTYAVLHPSNWDLNDKGCRS